MSFKRFTFRASCDSSEEVGLEKGVSTADAICRLADFEDMGLFERDTKTALLFGATIIMQEVCYNNRLKQSDKDKLRKFAYLLRGIEAVNFD